MLLAEPRWLVPHSAYIHIPFCRTKCLYCDFNTYAGKERLIGEYLRALVAEIARRAAERADTALDTVYFGGGTPSLLTVAQVGRVLRALRETGDIKHDAEVTLEANPGTFGPAYVEGLCQHGVSRLSLGIQSLDDDTLRRLARTHNSAQAIDAVRIARTCGMKSVNLDLIYGLPWQSLEGWREHLKRALDCEPHHVSLYALMVENGTPLQALVERGAWEVAGDDAVADMYEAALPILSTAGFHHYEVSNWARPGHESRHNLGYWRNEAYLGIGAGAHSYVQGRRFWNVRPIEGYIRRVSKRHDPTEGDETLLPDQQVGETAALALRLPVEGLDYARFRARYGIDPAARWQTQIAELVSMGLVEATKNRARVLESGLLVSSEIASRFL